MKNSDQPAYPQCFPLADMQSGMANPGLTKRELFAAMAMQGICANGDCRLDGMALRAEKAVKQSDALLAELDKENVCEWKWDTEAKVYRLDGRACTTNWTNCSPINFCPYCGRKIKEVK